MNRQRSSVRSRSSSSISGGSNPRDKVKDCCRQLVAFMCTQVGVGALIVGYALVGAASFMSIETAEPNLQLIEMAFKRQNFSLSLWEMTERYNLFNDSVWRAEADTILRDYQDEFTDYVRRGYDGRNPKDVWTFPAALMFCLSVFTMIGYGNIVPRTRWGKAMTIVYATFGIPLYILYFLNMGKVLAQCFKWLYRWLHDCSRDRDIENGNSDGGTGGGQRRLVMVPTTACLWVISFYVFTGTCLFAEWEHWSYLDSVYFCVTSLCKLGMGDFVPGANILDSQSGKQTKLAINFVYILLGMSLVAMCYNLMREEVRVKMREMREDMKLCLEDVRLRFANCCECGGGGGGGHHGSHGGKDDFEYYDY